MSNSLNRLIEERNEVQKVMINAHTDNDSSSHCNEVRIKLLQRREQAISQQIEELCSHDWGVPEYGYMRCCVCGRLRSTKHS